MPAEQIDVVFVHGVLSSGRAWDRFIRLIEEDSGLGPLVRPHLFEYDSPLVRFRLSERIAEIDDIADRLATALSTGDLAGARRVVLVSHSQGGLVVQRYLVRMLSENRGRELARIRHISMYACPNSGSEFLLSMRRWILRRRHPQELRLRPFDRLVTETQRIVLRDVVNAAGCTANQCQIPIAAYGGATDKIVPPYIAVGLFTVKAVVAGNHATIIRPATRDADSYQVLRQDLLAVTRGGATQPASADDLTERQGRVSVAPPLGRRDGQLHGRDGIIRAIMSGQTSQVHVLAGLGGTGKSRIALEIADRARRSGQQVWWVSLTRINGCMREVAYQLGIRESLIEFAWQKGGSPTDLVWRSLRERTEPWLLVFDNVDDPQELAAAGGQLSDGTGWIRSPAGSGGMVIVTSRDGNASTWGTWCTMHPVRPLESQDGAAMLMELTGPDAGDREQARRLSVELGGLPLALYAAARYVKSERGPGRVWTGEERIRTLGDYLDAVRKRFGSAPGASVPGRDLTESLGLAIVRQIFELSLDLLARRGLPEAAPLLKVLACLGTDPIPYHVLLTDDALGGAALLPNFPADRRHLALEGLADLGLIELDDQMPGIDDPSLSHVLSLHPVVHGVFRDDEDVRRRRVEYYSLNLRLLLAAVRGHDPDYPEGWAVWHLLVPHAVEVCRATLLGPTQLADQRVIPPALELARVTCRYLIVAGLIRPAEDLVGAIIGNCVPLGFQADDREILALRHERGRIAIELGDPVRAAAELQEVVAGRSAILGELDPDTLASRHKLAKAILDQSRWAEAETLLASIVEDERDVRGPEHPDTMVVRHSLARAIYAQGRLGEAETMLRQILAVRLRLWSPTTPETLYVRQTLTRCLLAQGKTEEAEREIRAALSGVADRRDVLVVLQLRHTHALVLLQMGARNEAIAELRRLLADRKEMLGSSHPETHRTLMDLNAVLERLPEDGQHQ